MGELYNSKKSLNKKLKFNFALIFGQNKENQHLILAF